MNYTVVKKDEFWCFQNSEQLPLGGQVEWLQDGIIHFRLMLYPPTPVSAGDPMPWWFGKPKDRKAEFDNEGVKVIFSENPLTINVIDNNNKKHLQTVIGTLSRKENSTKMSIISKTEDRYYGLGERFREVELSGRIIDCESADVYLENLIHSSGWNQTYYSVPLLVSSQGFALLMETGRSVRFDFSRISEDNEVSVSLNCPGINFYFIPGPDYGTILNKYMNLTGKPYIPPRWALELMMGHGITFEDRLFDQKVLDEYNMQVEKWGIPLRTIYDESWSWTKPDNRPESFTGYWFHPDQLGDFEIHNFNEPHQIIDSIHKKGCRIVYHISPFIGWKSKYLSFLLEQGFLVRRASEPDEPLRGQFGHYYLDFTNPAACDWFKQCLKGVMIQGIDGFFADFGEADEQRDALYYYGGTGASMGQRYSLLFRQSVSEVCRELKGNDYYFISRAGWTGMQQFAGALTGDHAGTFDGMRQALYAMLSLGLSGQGVAAHCLGGYGGDHCRDAYIRWTAMGVFSPLFAMWCSGEKGEPWLFEADVVELFSYWAKWRLRFIPYIHHYLHQYHEKGLPLVRAMVLAFPEDVNARDKFDQFMCGDYLLVAPIFNETGRREVYLPHGTWFDFWTGRKLDGGRCMDVEACYSRIPLFVCSNSVIPMECDGSFMKNRVNTPLELHFYDCFTNIKFDVHEEGKGFCISENENMVEFSWPALNRTELRLVFHNPSVVETVLMNGTALLKENIPCGFYFDEKDGVLHLRLPAGKSGIIDIIKG